MTVPKQAASEKKKKKNTKLSTLLLENAHLPLIDTCITIQSVQRVTNSNCQA